jgi:hypothetical protein
MAPGEMVMAGTPSEDLYGRKGTGSSAVARGSVVKPIPVDRHRRWYRPTGSWRRRMGFRVSLGHVSAHSTVEVPFARRMG